MAWPREHAKAAGCPLCAGSERRLLVTKNGCDVVRCRGCGLVHVWPQPPREALEALYSSGEYHTEVNEAERRRTFARRLREIEALAPARGRLLDVGCSKGYFIEAARASGWQATGVEVNRRAVEEARARGLDVRPGDLSGQGFGDASFDAVTLFDVLEHVGDPRALLAECRRLLRPGGLLVVTTPDVGGLVPRVTYGLFALTLGAWGHPTPPGHLVEFSRRTLRRALAEAGFEVVRERSEHIPVAYAAGKLENSIMDVLAGRHRQGAVGGGPSAAGRRPAAGGRRTSFLRGLPRCGARAVSWLVVGLTGLTARAVGWGDSVWVIGRARE
ncbi:MAG TPA: class I SAM-dependent methyltransferase [Planctomycetota bacterium]|nr:class I SAM-dependent methyltransferase [Planctomycetota bacterium]HRR78842.1 class I SAM-dependent methyltransferase [Planctomycetota bacterium]HRT92852.1 class I SAM-dependent methyltransferase [Planctomycetota bacterium]